MNNQASYRGNHILKQAPAPIADVGNRVVELGHAANNPPNHRIICGELP